jgi:hypothetical protein
MLIRTAALFGLLLSQPALALQMQLERPTLCSISSRVAVVQIDTIEAEWTSLYRIDRTVTAKVVEPVKGELGDTLTFTLRGGSLGETINWVEDQPRLSKGATYLLMLDGPGPTANITGGEQGAIRVTPANASLGERQAAAIASLGGCRAQ